MKRCPNCDKTFPDSMKFCQTDGTLLVADDAPPVDPYKTVVGNQSDIASAIPPADPFKTMIAPPPKKSDDNILDLPDEQDSLKTMVVSEEEMNELKKESAQKDSPLDLPPAPSAPLIEPQPSSPDVFKSKDASQNSPAFGDSGKAEKSVDAPAAKDLKPSGDLPSPSKFDSKTFPTDFSTQSPYGSADSQPIPSPFQDSMPPGGFQPSFGSPFSEPKSASKPEPAFREPEVESNQSPFGQQASSSPFEQNQWTPPPAPVSDWQNQEIGANTPFQPPVAAGGQNQTLAIVSLVLGILGLVSCGIAAPFALVTGFMARKKIANNPNEFGGSGLALAGMIIGAIGTLLLVLFILYVIFVFVLAASSIR